MKTIRVFDFTEYPGLRHCSISDDSGEEYYHKILNKEYKIKKPEVDKKKELGLIKRTIKRILE